MTDPATFLAFRLDEAEATAKAACVVWNVFHEDGEELKPTWSIHHQNDCTVIAGEKWTQTDDFVCNTDDEPSYARHIVLNDPAHVLAQIAAQRRIAELHTGSHECSCYRKAGGVMDFDAIDNCVWVAEYNEPCSTLELLARAYGWTEASP